MIDNQNTSNDKIKVNGLIQKYLESKSAKIVIDSENNIAIRSENATQQELEAGLEEWVYEQLKNSTLEDMLKLIETEVEIDFIKEEPAKTEGFFASYYNWFFGSKKEEPSQPEAEAKNTAAPRPER